MSLGADAAPRPVIVQGSGQPVFRGRSAETFRCAQCGYVLVEGYEPRRLIALDLECFACKSVTRTAEWPAGEPLPQSLVTFGDVGRFPVHGTVELTERHVFSCDAEIARVTASTAPRDRDGTPWKVSPEAFAALEAELDALTEGAFSDMVARAKKAEQSGNKAFAQFKSPAVWALRHIQRSLAERLLDFNGLDGIAFGYIEILRDALQRWGHHPRFREFARPLCHEFHHSMTALTIASYLAQHGNQVGITNRPRHGAQSPDLFFGDVEHPLAIEVKCPQAFFWPSPPPAPAEIARKVEREIKAARDQLPAKPGGVVVLGARQPGGFGASLEAAVHALAQRNQISTRVAAVSIVSFFGPTIEGWSSVGPNISSGANIHVVLNPRFAGENPIRT